MTKKLLYFILLISIPAVSQPYQIGHVSATFNDPARSRDIDVEIYYPSDVLGNNVAVTAGEFPILAFGHGFVMGFDAYENIWTSLVPQGFIMIFPKTEGGILPSHNEFAKDLNFTIARMQALTLDNTSIFFGKVSSKAALMGHSMGGGAAFLAAGMNPLVNALAVLAPAETNPSAIAAAGGLSIPALIFAGSNDCVTPPPANQIPMYDAMQSACKTYISIIGGSHCQMADSNFLCSFGEATCSPSAAISREAQHAVINNYLGDWLLAQLNSDCTAGAAFDSQIGIDTAITFQKTCLQCNALAVNDNVRSQISVYPNPVSS
ncbi:MAG: hypothetical protein EOO48_14005, partial [Flavobacterium sp.]